MPLTEIWAKRDMRLYCRPSIQTDYVDPKIFWIVPLGHSTILRSWAGKKPFFWTMGGSDGEWGDGCCMWPSGRLSLECGNSIVLATIHIGKVPILHMRTCLCVYEAGWRWVLAQCTYLNLKTSILGRVSQQVCTKWVNGLRLCHKRLTPSALRVALV